MAKAPAQKESVMSANALKAENEAMRERIRALEAKIQATKRRIAELDAELKGEVKS